MTNGERILKTDLFAEAFGLEQFLLLLPRITVT